MRKTGGLLILGTARSLLGTLLWFGLSTGYALGAGTAIDADAERVLRSMSAYLSGLSRVNVAADVDTEVVDLQGRKLQLTGLVTVTLERPDRLYVRRQGAYADVEIIFDGKKLTLHALSHGVYKQIESPGGIDAALSVLDQALGLDTPGSDLFGRDPYGDLVTDTTTGEYLGTTRVHGVECHYLAFRADHVDWQLWVQTGEAPLPMKYVITSKWITGAPQYAIRFRNWNESPEIPDGRFVFSPSGNTQAIKNITANEVGEFVLEEAQ